MIEKIVNKQYKFTNEYAIINIGDKSELECFLNGEFAVNYSAGDEGYIKNDYDSSVKHLVVENACIINTLDEDDEEILDSEVLKKIQDVIEKHFYYVDETNETIVLTDEGQEKLKKIVKG
jgi:hypothetical protein